ncbi:MAG TPA: OsmC family protein [Sediminibacterium sp.]|nr:OsmC family protein [Sediminibacterium sp.]
MSNQASIASTIGKTLYQVSIQTPSGNTLLADEPLDKGGQNTGFSPTELLAASLAACTSATLRMYADRKGWDLQEVKTEISLETDETTNHTHIDRKLRLIGNLDAEQRERLLYIANKCPVHKILSGPIEISTGLQ